MDKRLFLKILNESLEDYDDEVSDVEMTDINQHRDSFFDDTEFDDTLNKQLQDDEYFQNKGYTREHPGKPIELEDSFVKKIRGKNGSTRTIRARREWDMDNAWRDDSYGEGTYDDGVLMGKDEWDTSPRKERTPTRRDINKRNVDFDKVENDELYSDDWGNVVADIYDYGNNAVEYVDYDPFEDKK